MRRRKPIVLTCVSVMGVAMLCAGATASPRLIWNFTPSIPTGLYFLDDRDWKRGDRLALTPSGRLREALETSGVLKDDRLLMKRVAAVEGDEVCREGREVSVNGEIAAIARADASLPTWSGCVELNAKEIFLLGETEDSFDGRYFGPTSVEDIVGPVQLLLPF